MSWGTAFWLALQGSRADRLRIVLTALSTALATVAVLAAASVLAIGPDDGPYRNELLLQPGLRPGVALTLLLLCVPVLAVAGQCARVGAPARDRRLAAFRLAGATPRDVVRVACGEAGAAAAVGALLGLAGWLLLRVALGRTRSGEGFRRLEQTGPDGSLTVITLPVADTYYALPTDVAPPVLVIAALVLAVPLAATAFAWLALRRVTISPLGVARRRSSRPPRVVAAVCFLSGTAALAAFSTTLRVLDIDAGPEFALLFLGLFLVTSVGLVLGVAAVAAAVGRAVAARTGSPALLIAARRLASDPYGASRAYGALLLTVLVGAGAQGVRAFILAVTDPAESFYRDTLDLVDLVIVVAVVVAAVGLLVAAGEGIVSRRRTLAALTAAGTPVGVLRRAVVVQAVLPLLVAAPLAATAGLLAARGLFGTTYEQELPTATPVPDPPTVVLSVPVPWSAVAVLVVVTVALAALAAAASLVLLRGSVDQAELRAAA